MRCMMWCESIRAETFTCSSELVWSFSTEIHYQGGRSERNSTALEEETLSITLDRAEMWDRPVITGSRQSNFRRNQKLQCNKWTKVEAFPHTTFGEKFTRWKLFHSFLTCSPFFRSSQFVVQILCVISLLHPPTWKQLWDFLTIISNHELKKKVFHFTSPKSSIMLVR